MCDQTAGTHLHFCYQLFIHRTGDWPLCLALSLTAKLTVITRLGHLHLTEFQLRGLLIFGRLRVLLLVFYCAVKRHVLFWNSSKCKMLSGRCLLETRIVVHDLNLLFCSVLRSVALRIKKWKGIFGHLEVTLRIRFICAMSLHKQRSNRWHLVLSDGYRIRTLW